MATFYINPSTGLDANAGTSSGTAWKTVKASISKLTAGDTVHLEAGQYRENAVTSTKASITWICDGPVQWLGTRAQPGGGWGWVNHSGSAYKITAFSATYGFTPISIVEEDFNQWRPTLVDEDSLGNPVLYWFDKPMRAVGLYHSNSAGKQVTHCINYPGTMYYDSAADVLYYHTWQSSSPSALTIGIGAVGDGEWRLGASNLINPVGSTGYMLAAWCLRAAATTNQLNPGGNFRLEGSGCVLRQIFFLNTTGPFHSSSSVSTLEDCWIEGNTQAGPVREVTPTSITRSGSVATVTLPSSEAQMQTGMYKRIYGADQSEYNGLHLITKTSPTTFTFAVSGTPATPATGTIFVSHTEALNYASGPTPSPNTLSFTGSGVGSTIQRVYGIKGFNSITASVNGNFMTDMVLWGHPNHGISGVADVIMERVYTGGGQDGIFPSSVNTNGYTLTNSICGEGIGSGGAANVRSGTHRSSIIASIARNHVDATFDSDANILLGQKDMTTSATPGTSGTVWTNLGVSYEGAGPDSDTFAAIAQEETSRRLPSDAWLDDSLFQAFRHVRFAPILHELIPPPGSIALGMKVGFWQRFRYPQLFRPYPGKNYLTIDRPLAGC